MKLLLLILTLIPSLVFAEIYKSTDADGNTIYTDIPPTKDAKELEVEDLNISEAPKPSTGKSTSFKKLAAGASKPADNRYAQLKITAPADDATIRNNLGEVSVSVSLSPKLYTRYDDKLLIAIDGIVVNDGKSTTINLDEVERGTHTVTAYVEDKDGTSIMAAEPTTFHMFRSFKRN